MKGLLEISNSRHDKVQCLFMCVNLNLEILHDLLQRVSPVADRIQEIEKLLHPRVFLSDSGTANLRFHSFVVSHYFVSLVSEFEGFLAEILEVVIKRYPSKIGSATLRISEISHCETVDEAIEIAVGKYLNELSYKRPKEYIASLRELLSIEDSPEMNVLWTQFVEQKARRDLGVHNGWKNNEIYKRKVSEMGGVPSDQEFLAPDNEYFVNAADTIHQLMTGLYDHCSSKFSDEHE